MPTPRHCKTSRDLRRHADHVCLGFRFRACFRPPAHDSRPLFKKLPRSLRLRSSGGVEGWGLGLRDIE